MHELSDSQSRSLQLRPITASSALTHSVDSSFGLSVLWSDYGTDSLSSSFGRGSCIRLRTLLADRNRPQKHVARARTILHSAERLDVAEVARRAGLSRPAVWRWQQRFAEAGVDGLLRDKTRKPGKPPTPDAMVRGVVALTCAEPPGAATHWTGRMMATATGLSLRTVQRIWNAHKLQPHRIRTFKRSRDPDFVAKLADIVGLYVDPPMHAVVLSVDEKSHVWMASGPQG